jgi:hypothetical protein
LLHHQLTLQFHACSDCVLRLIQRTALDTVNRLTAATFIGTGTSGLTAPQQQLALESRTKKSNTRSTEEGRAHKTTHDRRNHRRWL